MFGKIIYRYIIREIASFFLLTLFILTFAVFMLQVPKLVESVVNYGVALSAIGRVLLYSLPPLLVFTVPMAFLLSVMLAVNRLSGDSELTAMKAAGVSLYQMVPSVLAFSAVVMGATFFLTLQAEPKGKQAIKNMLFELANQKAALSLLSERVFITDFDGMVLYINEIDSKTQELRGVFISVDQGDAPDTIVIAGSGALNQDPKTGKLALQLSGGNIHRASADGKIYETTGFGGLSYDISGRLSKALDEEGFQIAYHEMTMGELTAYMEKLRYTEGDTFDFRRAWVEYHRRFAFPFACLIFGLVALPLGIAPPRSGKSRGFSVAVVVMCVYYLLFRVAENLGWKAVAHPIILMWAPNLLFLAFGILLLHKKANEQPIRSIEFIAWKADSALSYIKSRIFKKKTRGGK